jgi:hypothetical protein
MMDYSGRALIGAELGTVLGVTDIDGAHPLSCQYTMGGPPELRSNAYGLIATIHMPLTAAMRVTEEVFSSSTPRRKAVGKKSPRASGPQHVEAHLDDLAHRPAAAATLSYTVAGES